MICKNENCKARISKKSVYCPKCGAKQYDESTPENADYLSMSSEEPNRTYRIKRINNLVCFFLPVVVVVFGFLLLKIGNSCSVDNSIETEPTTSITAETQATYPTKEEFVYEPNTVSVEDAYISYEYNLSDSPVKVTDCSVSSSNGSVDLSISFSYKPEDKEKIVKQVTFYATPLQSNGFPYDTSKEFIYTDSVKNNASYDIEFTDAWSSNEIVSADIYRIVIEYKNSNHVHIYADRIKENVKPQPEVKPQVCPIKVTSCYTGAPNSADGVDLYINWYNEGEKEIKYISFSVIPYNRVNDMQSCEIRNHSRFNARVTGPFYYGSSESTYWDCAWYNSDIDHPEIGHIWIDYMDGSSEKYYEGW